MYPTNWLPPENPASVIDAQGRFLGDFSWAGYHNGEVRPPYGTRPVVATVSASLGNGTTDATAAIQAAINTACSTAGGGAVQLPAGTYRVLLPAATAAAALLINCSNVVLRGAGRAQTFIYFDDAARVQGKAVIRLAGTGSAVDSASTTTRALSADLTRATRALPMVSTAGLTVGNLIAIHSDVTPAYRLEHRMDAAMTGEVDYWPSPGDNGLIYLRRIVALTATSITLDEPTRLPMKVRDGARVYTRPTFISESGIEDLAIGMRESTAPGGRDADDDYGIDGTMGFEVHASNAVLVDSAMDVWLYRVDTYKPPANALAHVLSNAFTVARGASRVTVEDCDLGPPGYRGGGGNGYLFQISGQDVLLVDIRGEGGRHNFLVTDSTASGDVFLRATTVSPRLTNDSHRFLSHQNLFDQTVQIASWWSAVNRRNTSGGAGFTATQSVFWRTHTQSLHPSSQQCAIETAQFDWGYVIGTSGAGKVCLSSVTNGYWNAGDQGAPADYVEGADAGTTLVPTSLYLDQRARRCARDSRTCTAGWP
ncbi:MAG: hypothetical protein IPJ65_30425 [Archangiaceae bacterium]|nr:hypothetical protein [Archangiaceae bacterium]